MKNILLGTLHIKPTTSIEVADIATTLTFLQQQYQKIYLSISSVTKPNIKQVCQGLVGENFQLIELPVIGTAGARRELLTFAKQQEMDQVLRYERLTAAFHLCDFDRLITWVKIAPNELKILSRRKIAEDEYLVLGRTATAFASHPVAWQKTEKLVNQVAADFFHLPELDLTAGSELIAPEIVDWLLADNQARLNDGEWPRNVLRNGGTISYQACEGLRFDAALNGDQLIDDGFSLMQRLQLAAAITQSLYQ